MSRYSGGGSYGHRIAYFPDYGGWYRLSWRVDKYYPGSRIRHPRTQTRDTDEKGARRFAKRWQILDSRLPEQLRKVTP